LPNQVEFSDAVIDAARDLVKAGRTKKLVENRCLAAFNEAGYPILSDEETMKLAVDIVTSVEIFVEAGEMFSEELNKEAMAKGGN
jgi:hypothetical protein